MTNRPNFTKTDATTVYNRLKNPYGIGHCWHCGKKLVFKNRTYGKKGAWHIDHYPVVYRDIENQCCCGITGPQHLNNLVPSCVNCNISHRNELSLRICGGRSQCKCEGSCVFWTFMKIMGGIAIGLLLSLLVLAFIRHETGN